MSDEEYDIDAWHKIITDTFLDTCEVICQKDLDDHEFKFCVDSIQNTLIYLKERRKWTT